MQNDPELQMQAKYLGEITKDFAMVAETLKEASYQLRVRDFEYPIFPICKEELPIGKLLIHKNELLLTWNYNVSFLNEFVQRQLVAEEHIEDFIKAYKEPDEFCCLFVVDKEFTHFVYLPYPVD